MLLSKKRYHGHYYTKYGSPEYYPNSMGIVLKRRDNAPIVKHIFGGTLDIIFQEHNIQKAVEYCKKETDKLLKGEFSIDMFIITKTLKSYYKAPEQIAHYILAQRIAERDPGNKVQSNDRMAFAYIKTKNNNQQNSSNKEKVLQGYKIETPEFIKKTSTQLDYKFYLTNQVMKPVLQIFELKKNEVVIEDLFIKPLIEYDRTSKGITTIDSWLINVKKDDEYQIKKEYKKLIETILAENEKDSESDKINMDDELYN